MAMDLTRLAHSLHTLERKILPFLHDNISITEISAKSKLKEDEIMHALKWMQNKKLLGIKASSYEIVSLDKNGLYYLKHGLPERNLISLIKDKILTLEQIRHSYKDKKDDINPGIGALRQKNLISIKKDEKAVKFGLNSDGLNYINQPLPEEILLKRISERIHTINDFNTFDKKLLDSLKRRKEFIKTEPQKSKHVILTDLCKQLLSQKIDLDLIEAITPDIIKNKEYKSKAIRRYDVEVKVPRIFAGRKHFINEAVSYIRRIWLDMGFKEMKGNLIQPGFWNFDALFTPQDHPARELQDTLFVNGIGKLPGKELVNKIKNVHENGSDTGSKGWNYKWDITQSKELLLRTHTTVLSALTISSLKKGDLPCKYFSIGKCFRNETIDWKHGFEFTQVEGIVADENANFRNLLGYLKRYYSKLGFDEIRFRPHYFPYTEMSVEVDVYHKQMKEWLELGGAGMFRPEVVKPLLGKDIPVLAWGQGMERSIMDYYKINDFRELYKNDLKLLREVKPWLK